MDTTADGLSDAQARRRLAADGPNELPSSPPRDLLQLLRQVLLEPMFLLLVACGVIYLALGDRQEALMLLGFVVVVMGITIVQQHRTERSLRALRDFASPRALVVRDGQARRIAGRDVVRGDIVLLAEGDRVPADIRLLDAANLGVDESLLTGESAPVAKRPTSPADAPPGAPGDADPGWVYSGTLVTSGTARGSVVATGARSALGRIGASLGGIAQADTAVQAETRRIVARIAIIGLALAAALALFYWWLRGDALHGLLAGLTLAMGILPEELPVVLTLFLGLGAWRLAREKVLARNIPAVEVLGAATVLCVDKTGTLTANRMTVRRLWSTDAMHDTAAASAAPVPEPLHGVLEFAVLASHRRAFDPMEAAIVEAGRRHLADTEHLHADWTLVEDYPLSDRMLAMSRVWQSPDRRSRMIAAKGAPEAIVDLCHLDAARAASIADAVAAMAADGLRVLGVACSSVDVPALPRDQHDFDFAFLGLVALEDPVRPDVPRALDECRAAGIRVVMITGDHPVTARAIARQVGLDADAALLTGTALATMDDRELDARLAGIQVFCRVQPEQKLRLVQAFRARGDIVAMTGDGVNDAPALKAADIGVAMGAHGTDVAREAADLVLVNDDFASIVTAVRHGRRVFDNLRKAIVFVIAVHIPIVGLSIAPVLLGWPMLLMPAHILFLQLIIDPACTVVFEAEPLEPTAMSRPPRPANARLFDTAVLQRGLWQGAGLLAILLGVFAGARALALTDDAARALTFTVLVLSNLGLIHANRSWERGASRHHGAFLWIATGTLALLAGTLAIGPVRQLFSFALPAAPLLAAGLGAAVTSFLWFTAVKRVQRADARSRALAPADIST